MSRLPFQAKLESPSATEFNALRNKIGWGLLPDSLVTSSMAKSLFHVVVRHQDKSVGMGRVIGDGAMYFYVQDVVVDPDYQGKGIGQRLMEQIELYLQEHAQKGATIGLLAAQGKEEFYTRFAYMKRNGDPLGLGMCKFL